MGSEPKILKNTRLDEPSINIHKKSIAFRVLKNIPKGPPLKGFKKSIPKKIHSFKGLEISKKSTYKKLFLKNLCLAKIFIMHAFMGSEPKILKKKKKGLEKIFLKNARLYSLKHFALIALKKCF